MSQNLDEIKSKIRGPIFQLSHLLKNEGKDIDYTSLENYIKFLYKGGAKIFYAMAFNTRYLIMKKKL